MAELVIKLVNGELAGKTVQSLRKEINAAARDANKAEIGTKAWIDAHQRLDKSKKQMEDVRKQVQSTTKASDELKEAWTRFVPFSGTFQKIGESLGFVTKGVGGLTRGFGILKAAIISTGIGALVVLLGSLVTWLASTQEGMDKITSVTRPLAAIFQRLIGVVQELGGQVFKRLAEAVKDPRQAFIDLGNAIKDNLISRFEALGKFGPALAKIFRGEFASGFKDLGNAVLQVSTGVENAIDKMGQAASELGDFVSEAVAQGKRLDELQKAIERAEINRIVRSKQLELIVAQQKKISDDETATFDQRRQAAMAAMKAQEDLIKLEQSVLDMRIAKLELEHSLNDTSREEEKELAELKAQRLEVEARLTEQSIELNNKLNTINKTEAAEALAIEKNLQDLKLEARQEGIDKQIADINKQTDQRIEALKGSEDQITEQALLLEDIRNQRITELRDQHAKEQQEKSVEEALARHELALATEQNLLNERFLAQQLSEEQFAMMTAENAVNFQQQKLELLRRAHGEESLEYQRAYGEFLGLQQAQADQAVAIKQQEMDDQMAAMVGSLGTFGNFFGAIAGMQEQGTQQWKSFATAQAILSTIQGSINAYTSTAAIPIIGSVLAPIAAAIALAAGYAQVRKIQDTKVTPPVKKAALGGELVGPSHEQGGIPLEAEGGEFMFSRKAASAIGMDTLNRINSYYTRKYQAGGPVSPFADRPPIPSAASQAFQAPGAQSQQKPAWVDELIAAQDRRMDRLRVFNVVTDTEEGIKTVNQIRDDADV